MALVIIACVLRGAGSWFEVEIEETCITGDSKAKGTSMWMLEIGTKLVHVV